MANTTIQLKRSGITSNVPSSLEYGELSLNYADGLLYYKNSNGYIVSFSSGGNAFGTVNANGTFVVAGTQSDILRLISGPGITITGNAINDTVTIGVTDGSSMNYPYVNASVAGANAWTNTVSNTKVSSVTGTAGQIYSSGGTTPTLNLITTAVTAATYGSSNTIPVIAVDSFGRITSASNTALSVTGGANIGDTAPVSPKNGDLWWSSTLGRLFVYYTDIDSSQWVDASPDTLASSTALVSLINNALQNATGTLVGTLTVAGGVNTTNISTSTNVASFGTSLRILANGDIVISGSQNIIML